MLEQVKPKKKVIIEEAALIINEKGYVAMTMRDLATRVGIEAASLYNHIQSKEQILSFICFKLADTYTEAMATIDGSDLNSSDKIRRLISLHVQINAENATLASVMNDEWRHLSEPDLSRFLELRRAYEHRFHDIIQQGIDNGDIKHMDARIALYTILSSVRWLQHWYNENRHVSIQMIEQNITHLLMNGLVR